MKAAVIAVFLGLGLAFGGLPAEAASGFSCNGRLVSVGDRSFDVLQRCGEPDYREVISSQIGPGVGVIPHEEVWHYNFGPQRHVRVLLFREGRLRRIESGGYGYIAPSERCNPGDIQRNLTALELLGRCGEPDHKERRVEPLYYHRDLIVGHGRVVEEWIYNFGPQRFQRIATLREGRVTRVERGERGY